MTPASRIRVLIVDDSALMREVLTQVLSQDEGIEVVGTAPDPIIARDKVLRLHPDVITLDVEMPRMDGLAFLEKLMQAHPLPVLMVSSLTERGCETTVRALELGAIDYVTKPKLDVRSGTLQNAREIIGKIKTAARAKVHRHASALAVGTVKRAVNGIPAPLSFRTTHRVFAIGASTGGTEALAKLLASLPPDSPGVVVVQHMPAGFTRAFAGRLDSLCQVRVSEAKDGDAVLAGHVLLAPGNLHMEVVRFGASVKVKVFHASPVNHHRPSVDLLFSSCARFLGRNAVGAILTGMGSDGARGLLAMRQAGARTIAQDEDSCVVFGMPKEAIALGAAEMVCPLDQIAPTLLRLGDYEFVQSEHA